MKLNLNARHWHWCVMALSALVMAGCLETNDHFILNPDGSGKLIHEAKFVNVEMNMGGAKKSEQEKAKAAAQKLISESVGVDAWQEVTYSLDPDGRVAFQGIAYFPDITKLQLKHGGAKLELFTPVYRIEGGKGVLELKWSDKEDSDSNTNTDSADGTPKEANELTAERAKYQQMKPMMAAMFGNLKLRQKYTLPAPVESASNMTQEGGDVVFQLDGLKVIQAMDSYISDDAWLLAQLNQGKSMGKDFSPDASFNEKLFGSEGPIQATTAGSGSASFDYTTEMEAARSGMTAMFEQLGFNETTAKTKMQPPAEGAEFTELVVGGIRLVRDVGDDTIRPFNWNTGLSVSLTGTFAGSVLDVKEGMVTHAETLEGQNLLPDSEFEQRIGFPNMSEDQTRVTFETKLELPAEQSRGIKRLAGTLEYWTSTATREVDLGLTSLATGTKGAKLGAVIGDYSENNWGNKKQYEVQLDLEVPIAEVKEVRFLDSSGKWLEGVKKSGHSAFNDSVSMNFSSEQPFPPQGNIIVVMHDELKKFTIPFEVGPFDWMGMPIAE